MTSPAPVASIPSANTAMGVGLHPRRRTTMAELGRCIGCGAVVVSETSCGVTVPVCTLSGVCPGRCVGLVRLRARENKQQTDLLIARSEREDDK